MPDSQSTSPAALTQVLHYGAVIKMPRLPAALPFDLEALRSARSRRESAQPDRDTLFDEGSRL